jgi:hypothetical protein
MSSVPATLTTSPDAQWAAVRIGREVTLLAAGVSPAVGRIELDSDDVDLALVGPPAVLLAVSRGDSNKIVLYQPPYLDAVARLDLEIPANLVTTTGPRAVVVSPDAMHAMVVRAANRALATQKLEVAGPIEFVVGLERNQLLFGLHKKLEVWDAVSGRPLLRPQFQLPPAPRVLGAAHGHLWALRQGAEELFLYRLSDGRPFRHHAGAPIRQVVCHPASPLLVLVTDTGFVRLHCFSHTMTTLDAIPARPTALAQLAVGDDVTLLGLVDRDREPWRMVIGGAGGPATTSSTVTSLPGVDAAQSTAEGGPAPVRSHDAGSSQPVTTPRVSGGAWRETLAVLGAELVRGETAELPVLAIDSDLGDLAHRLGLSASARRALIALYAVHLVGEPAVSIARLAQITGSWPEALGQGDLGQLAMLEQQRGRVWLRHAVTDLCDGVPPRSIRIAGGAPTTPHAGTWRQARDGRTDAEIEAQLASQLGRLAFVEGDGPLADALLEAHLRGATAIATSISGHRPRPWPRGAGLVLVLYGTQTSWVAEVPTLTAEG